MPHSISELVLKVRDIRAGVEFYRNLLGLQLEEPFSDDWAWFKLSDNPPQRFALRKGTLLFEEHSPRVAEERFGPVHFAFQVDRSELEATTARLRDAGIDLHGPVALDWMNADSVYCYDPDDNLVELWCLRE